jgi:2-methylcitrate dehydratase PrpD
MSLTGQLIALVRAKPASAGDFDAAALFVLDTIACAFAARRSPQGRILLDWYRDEARDPERRAFLFGSLVHVLEMDDLHRESVTHPACVVIPAAWSTAARLGLNGQLFLRAVLEGYEACCRVGNAVGPAHYKIWHNTATCGPYGAAFAAASLRNLSDEKTSWALGNAGTQSSGLWQFLEEGVMSKHLHAGRAAESGQLAAELAAWGFTGPAEILEGKKGFFMAACPDADPDRILSAPNDDWMLRQTSIKPWPSCRHTHPVIEAGLQLHNQLSLDSIDEIRIETYQAALDLCDQANPTSEYEAKFSLQHCAALALTDGRATFASFDAAARNRLASLRSKVAVVHRADFDQAYPGSWGAKLSIRTVAGESITAECLVCKGDPESPLSKDAMCEKASALFQHAELPSDRAAALIDAVLALPEQGALPNIDALFR